MSLVLPELGLIFWQLVVFALLFFILTKFAWKPITSALHEREANIEGALKQAELARQDMAKLKAENEALLKEARHERERMLTEARTTSSAIIDEARGKASEEADRLIVSARQSIQTEKAAAIADLKNQVATYSVEIAEKILKNQLDDKAAQQALISRQLDEVKFN